MMNSAPGNGTVSIELCQFVNCTLSSGIIGSLYEGNKIWISITEVSKWLISLTQKGWPDIVSAVLKRWETYKTPKILFLRKLLEKGRPTSKKWQIKADKEQDWERIYLKKKKFESRILKYEYIFGKKLFESQMRIFRKIHDSNQKSKSFGKKVIRITNPNLSIEKWFLIRIFCIFQITLRVWKRIQKNHYFEKKKSIGGRKSLLLQSIPIRQNTKSTNAGVFFNKKWKGIKVREKKDSPWCWNSNFNFWIRITN